MTDPLAALVDTNVLLDVFYDDPAWAGWSIEQLKRVSMRGALAINDVVYAELSVRFTTIESLDDAVARAGLRLFQMSRAALFLAGKAFARYRSGGGPRTSILPDFLIGAHASALGVPLLTRDARRYSAYFPRLALVTP